MKFRYSAPDPDGIVEVGFVEADDEAAARDQLQARGIQPDLVEAVLDEPVESSGVRPKTSWLPSTEKTETVGQIGAMIGAGVPLSAGLRALAEELPSRRLRETFGKMSEELDEGRSLEDVVQSHSDSLPPWLSGVIHAGSESGRLAESVEHYVQFARVRTAQVGKLLICMTYPAILLVIATVLAVVMLTWITPEFRDIFYGFGMDLPALTQSMIHLADIALTLTGNWLVTLGIILLVTAGPVLLLRLLAGPGAWRRLLYEIPILGRLFKLLALSEFCHLLALYVENRIPLPKAFELVSCAMRDPNLKLAAADAAGHLNRGVAANRLDAYVPEFPTELMRISGWEAGEAELAESLRATSDLFRIQSDVNSTSIAGFAGPLAVLLIAGSMGLFVISMFIPLVRLLNDLS